MEVSATTTPARLESIARRTAESTIALSYHDGTRDIEQVVPERSSESLTRGVEPTSSRDVLLLAVAAMAIAVASPLAKASVGLDAFGIGAGRCAVGAGALFCLAPQQTLRGLAGLTARQLAALVFAGALLAAHFALFLWGLATTSLPAAVALVSLEPLAVVLLAWISFGLRPRAGEAIGLAIAVAGALFIARGAGEGENRLIGDLFVLGAVILYGAYVAAARGLQHLMPVMPYAACVYGVAALALAPLALPGLRANGIPPPRTIGFVIAMGLVPTLVGHTLIQRLARRLSPSVVALVPAGETVGSLAIAAVLQGIWPTRTEWLGTAGILVGVVLVSRATARTSA
jgi:drug/metabolite transporter (DMT)-like permease